MIHWDGYVKDSLKIIPKKSEFYHLKTHFLTIPLHEILQEEGAYLLRYLVKIPNPDSSRTRDVIIEHHYLDAILQPQKVIQDNTWHEGRF